MKVSLITVCFNSVDTIADTIRSVAMQDYADIEYIIVDGGSTDGTLDVIASYGQHVSRLVSEPDEGIYDAMNKGVLLSTGGIVAFLNSDDMYANATVVREMVTFMEAGGLDAGYGDLAYVDRTRPDRSRRFWKTGAYKRGRFRYGWAIPHPAFFCRRHVFEKWGSFSKEFRIAGDFELLLRFIEKHQICVGYIPIVVAKMRMGGRANTVRGVIRGNWEILKAFRRNGLRISMLFFVLKPIARIQQFLIHSEPFGRQDKVLAEKPMAASNKDS